MTGFVHCGQGHEHWGPHGAAGLLVHHQDRVLLQHRSPAVAHGNTWSLPGGACHPGEDPVTTALRETAEETTLDTSRVTTFGWVVDDHRGWTYTTVIGTVPTRSPVRPTNWESTDVAWVPVDDVTRLSLHPHFRSAWPQLHQTVLATQVVHTGQ